MTMTTTFEMNASELDNKFVAVVKELFKDKKIQITVGVEMDETDYLNSSEANRKMLLKSLKQAAKGETVTVSLNKLKSA